MKERLTSLEANQLTGFCEENLGFNFVLSESRTRKETPTAPLYIFTKIRSSTKNSKHISSPRNLREKSKGKKYRQHLKVRWQIQQQCQASLNLQSVQAPIFTQSPYILVFGYPSAFPQSDFSVNPHNIQGFHP